MVLALVCTIALMACLELVQSGTATEKLVDVGLILVSGATVTCPQFPYQSKFQKSKVCKINLFLR